MDRAMALRPNHREDSRAEAVVAVAVDAAATESCSLILGDAYD